MKFLIPDSWLMKFFRTETVALEVGAYSTADESILRIGPASGSTLHGKLLRTMPQNVLSGIEGRDFVLILSEDQPMILGFWRDGSEASVEIEEVSEAIHSRRKGLVGNLGDKRALVAGLGNLGGKIAEGLGRVGVRNFMLLDKDIVEASNLSRTTFTIRDLGYSKVSATERILTDINPDTSIESEVCDISALPEDILANYVRTSDLIIAAADHIPSIKRLTEAAIVNLKPIIAVFSFDNAFASAAAWWAPEFAPMPCPVCWIFRLNDSTKLREVPEELRRDYAVDAFNWVSGILPDCVPITGASVSFALAFLDPQTTERRFLLDYTRGTPCIVWAAWRRPAVEWILTPGEPVFWKMNEEHHPDCPVCSEV